jgi:hypothetical protein
VPCRVVIFLLAFAAPFARATPDQDFFERNGRPILATHCYKCHAPTSLKIRGDLRLDTRDGAT